MPTYARIQSAHVAELFAPPAGVELSACFVSDVAAQFVDVTNVAPAPQPGWTARQSNGAWLFAAPSPPVLTLEQQAQTALNSGLTLTLSGNMTLAATAFPVDPTTTGKIAAVITTIVTTGAFPGGATAYPMKDMTGITWHTFTSDQYKAVAASIASFAAALDLIIDGNPLNATALPAASISLTV